MWVCNVRKLTITTCLISLPLILQFCIVGKLTINTRLISLLLIIKLAKRNKNKYKIKEWEKCVLTRSNNEFKKKSWARKSLPTRIIPLKAKALTQKKVNNKKELFRNHACKRFEEIRRRIVHFMGKKWAKFLSLNLNKYEFNKLKILKKKYEMRV